MSTIIKAIFDSPDFADNAQAELRRSGINIRAYKATPIEQQSQDDNGAVLPIMATNSAVYGATAMTTGVIGAGFLALASDDTRVLKDTMSTEVIANMTVDDEQAAAVEAALVSMGGRQVGVV